MRVRLAYIVNGQRREEEVEARDTCAAVLGLVGKLDVRGETPSYVSAKEVCNATDA